MSILQTNYNHSQPAALFEFTQGIDLDKHLVQEEIAVQKAWAKALEQIGVLKKVELDEADDLLDQAEKHMLDGTFEWSVADEDIHMNLERFLTENNPHLGPKIHAGRSRNDLIATTLRLYASKRTSEVHSSLNTLVDEIVKKSHEYIDLLVPGMTHLQHGQPIRFSQIFSSHGWALARDMRRLSHAQQSTVASMPLGSAALNGTRLNIDRDMLARTLGFSQPSYNSYDSVGDRDFIVETLDAFASVASHLRRMSQDMIYWSSTPVGLVKLPRDWATGSSIMPNKRNPDVPELVRARASKIALAAANAHALLGSLQSSYASDLHELKAILIDATVQLQSCLKVFTSFIKGITIDRQRANQLLASGHLLATAMADHLQAEGLSLRDSYRKIAELVEFADNQQVEIHELPENEILKRAPEFAANFIGKLSWESSVESCSSVGGTAKSNVADALKRLAHFGENAAPMVAAQTYQGRGWEFSEWL